MRSSSLRQKNVFVAGCVFCVSALSFVLLPNPLSAGDNVELTPPCNAAECKYSHAVKDFQQHTYIGTCVVPNLKEVEIICITSGSAYIECEDAMNGPTQAQCMCLNTGSDQPKKHPVEFIIKCIQN